jgi:hypothetical protein
MLALLQKLPPPLTDTVPGAGLTVRVVVVAHPVGAVYVIIVVPESNPATIPLVLPMVALEISLLIHVPPVGVLESVTPAFSHTAEPPVIEAGNGLMVTAIDASGPQHPNADCTLK